MRVLTLAAILTSLTAYLAGCTSVVKKDAQTLCGAPNIEAVKKVSASTPSVDPAQLNRVMADAVDKEVTSQDGRTILAALLNSRASLAARGKVLQELANEQGISPCPWADWLQAQPGH